MKFKKLLKKWRYLKNQYLISTEDNFTNIYKKNIWGGHSSSGRGSDLDQTETLRTELLKLIQELNITSLLDIPCGDFNWMKETDLNFLSYTGADIVDEIVLKNNQKYSNDARKFIKLNILKDKLPRTDLILCRDLFQHFSNKDIFKAINNIKKSKARYLLTSSQIETKENIDTYTGSFRPLNLLIPPFNFPKPLRLIDEKNPTKEGSDKSLLLWEIESLI